MSNVIDFLEMLGRDAQLRYAPDEALEQALTRSQIQPAIGLAILAGDLRGLEHMLGATTNVCCMVHAPDDDEDQPEDDEPEQEDDDDKDEKGARSRN